MGGGGQNLTFLEHGHVAYLKENQECSKMPHGSKYFAHRHPPPPRPLGRESRTKQHGSKYFAPYPYSPPSSTLGMGSVGQNSIFSEHRHVAYLKENPECSNMPQGSKYFAHRHPPPPRPLGRESRMQQHGCKYFAPYPYSTLALGMGSVGQKRITNAATR